MIGSKSDPSYDVQYDDDENLFGEGISAYLTRIRDPVVPTNNLASFIFLTGP
jgi:hypothetical protein